MIYLSRTRRVFPGHASPRPGQAPCGATVSAASACGRTLVHVTGGQGALLILIHGEEVKAQGLVLQTPAGERRRAAQPWRQPGIVGQCRLPHVHVTPCGYGYVIIHTYIHTAQLE